MPKKNITPKTNSLSSLEDSLKTVLNPVAPSNDFVDGVRSRLVSGSMVGLENNSPILIYLVLAMGLFMGVLMFWIIRRLR